MDTASLQQLLTYILTGLTGSGLMAIANFVFTRGQVAKTNAKIAETKADALAATSDVETRTDKLRQEALEQSVRRTDKLEDKFEALRSEHVITLTENAKLKGQVDVLLLNQTAANAQIQSLTMALGEQKAQNVVAIQSGEKYQGRVEALEAQVQDLQKQVKNLTEMLAQVTKERDTAVDKLAAQTPIAMSPATATP